MLNPENPPVIWSGRARRSICSTANRSFISPALQVSESADTNGATTSSAASGWSRRSPAFSELSICSNSGPRAISFSSIVGGGAFYSNPYHGQATACRRPGSRHPLANRPSDVARRLQSTCPTVPFKSAFGGVPGLGLPPAAGHGTDRGRFAWQPPVRQRSVRFGRRYSAAREHRDSRCRSGDQSGLRRSPWRADSATPISTIPRII